MARNLSSRRRGDSRIFLKAPQVRTSLLNINLISAVFISLDSTFNRATTPWKSEQQSAPTIYNNNRQRTRLTTRNQQQLPTDNSIRQSTTITRQLPHAWQPGTNNNYRQTAATDSQQSADYCRLSTNNYGNTDRYTRDNQNQHLTTNRQKSTGWKYSKTRLEATTSSDALSNHNPHFWQQ